MFNGDIVVPSSGGDQPSLVIAGTAPVTPTTLPPALRSPLTTDATGDFGSAADVPISTVFPPAPATPSPTSLNRLFPTDVSSLSNITKDSRLYPGFGRTFSSAPSTGAPSIGRNGQRQQRSCLFSSGSAAETRRVFSAGRSLSSLSANNISAISSSSREKSGNKVRRGGKSVSRSNFCTPAQKRPLVTGSSSVLRTCTPGGASLAGAEDLAGTAVIAVTGGRGNALGEVGLASFDTGSPGIILSQFSDSYTFAGLVKKIVVLNPAKILLPNTLCDPSKVLYQTLCAEFGDDMVAPLSRYYYRSSAGVERLTALCQPSYSAVLHSISHAYYCSSAAAALLEYLEQMRSIAFRARSIKVQLQTAESTMFIDTDSARRLELVTSSSSAASCSDDPQRARQSVFACIRRTRTPGGTRRLRAELLQPSIDLASILSRQDCINELLANSELLYHLRAVVGRFQDIEKVHCFCIQKHSANCYKNVEQRINCLMALKSSLDVVDALNNALEPAQCAMFASLRALLIDDNYRALVAKLHTVMHEDIEPSRSAAEQRVRRCYAIRAHVNGLLDVARRLYTETTDSFISYVSSLAEKYSLPLQAACNSARGFHITALLSKHIRADDLPSELVQMQCRRSHYVFTSETVTQLNAKADYTAGEIGKMSNTIVCSLLDQLAPHLGYLYQLTEVVTCVDLMVSLAEWSAAGAVMCCPRVVAGHGMTGDTSSDGGAGWQESLVIRRGHHPLLQQSPDHTLVVENDTVLSQQQRLMVLTGPNMSGKSTYLKQVAVIQILAQLGCFVPAESACVPLVNRVFYRSGYDNSVDSGLSAFMSEMRHMCRVVHEAAGGSLALLDEPCRATNPVEASAICWALCEQLMTARCLTIVATHHQRLCHLQHFYYPLMVNCHFGTSADSQLCENTPECSDSTTVGASTAGARTADRLSHRLSAGALSCTGYGVQLAGTTALPQSVIAAASCVVSAIALKQISDKYDHSEESHGRLLFNLAGQLMSVARGDDRAREDDTEAVRRRLIALREQFVSVQRSAALPEQH